jgi:serine/threonine protein kinase
MPESNPWQAGQKVGDGRFTLVKQLGRGGMGVVWLAQDTRLDEPVALKFLPPEIAADSVALNDLRRETARSHHLTHPNIIRLHDFQQSDHVAFISMEYVEGSTLSEWRLQQAQQVVTWEQMAPLAQQLCAALEYAHGEGVVHRDLKPANIMVDSRGRVKLADFGIATVVSDSMSRVSAARSTSGTLPYMSPQQLTGKRPSVTDDIYSLGVTLYELLTSKPPFYTGDLTYQVLREPPEPMAERLAALEIQNEIPGDVSALVMACLAKEPAQRPQSARAVAEWIGLEVVPKPSLEALSNDVSQQAQPSEEPAAPPEADQASPAPPASKKGLWAGAAIAAVVVLALGGWYWSARRSPQNLTKTADSSIQLGAAQASELAAKPSVPFSGELPGTIWQVTDSDGDNYHFQFEPNGLLNYEARRGVRPNGRWQQEGANVTIDINDGYTTFSGTLDGAKMSGTATSREGKRRTWNAVPKS